MMAVEYVITTTTSPACSALLKRQPLVIFSCWKMLLVTLLLLVSVALSPATDAKQDAKKRELVVVNTIKEFGTRKPTGFSPKPNTPKPESNEYSAEHALYENLLGKSYQKHVRPVRNHHKPITVKVGMCVMMIEDLIERDQIMVMASCVKMVWTDDFLAWDPEKFGNITWMAISSDKIWLPDIAIVNSPEPHSLTRKSTNVDLTYDGGVGYFPSGRLTTRCNVIISYFPFDRQNCEVRFESWIYPSQYLEIELYPGDEAVDIKEYYVNLHWTILGYRALPEKVDYDGKNFSCITFVFSLRRKSAFYFMYFIFPELMLALLQTLSHTLPVEHPGRMTMLTALFIGASVTHAGIAAHIPKSSDSMSLLQIYMAIVSVNLVFALINSFVMLYTVLRYPNKEPSAIAMFASFFSIIWPDKMPRRSNNGMKRSSNSSNNNNNCFSNKKHDRSGARSRNADKKIEYDQDTTLLTLPGGVNASPGNDVRSAKHSGIMKTSSSHYLSSQNTVPLHPGSWILDPTQHSPNCKQANERFLPNMSTSNFDNVAKVRSPSGENKFSGDILESFYSTLLLEDDRSPSQPKLASKSAVAVGLKAVVHQPLTRKASSYGGGSSTQYMSKASCLQQQHHSRRDDEEEDENGCALVLSPPTIYVDSKPADLDDTSSAYHRRDSDIWHKQQDIAEPKQSPSYASMAAPRQSQEDRHRKSIFARRRNSSKDSDSTSTSSSEYKHRWLVYCVALDKSIMYVNGVWNLIIPLTLFVILPWLNDVLAMDNLS